VMRRVSQVRDERYQLLRGLFYARDELDAEAGARLHAVTLNAGVGKLPATITAPNGGIAIGSRNTVVGCVGGKDVVFEPDSHISG